MPSTAFLLFIFCSAVQFLTRVKKRSSDKAPASNVGLKKELMEVDIQTERKERTVELGQGRSEDASHLKNLLVLLNKKYVNCT